MSDSEQKILQKNLAQFLTHEVFNIITEDDILKVEGNNWTLKGEKLPDVAIKTLQSQARGFVNSKLWEILRTELRWHVYDKLVNKSKSEEDLIAGKVLGYLVDIIDSKLKRMSE